MTVPPPLTPPDCDLRDFRFMPLDVVRFTHSDLVSTADPEVVVAAIRLWAASWHQVPAASLTDDDRTLSQLAGYGRAVAAWLAVKAEALRGFIKCSDGRLYHPVVAEKAREAFRGKLQQRHRTFTAAIRKHNERYPGDRRATPTFEEWLEAGRPTSVTRETAKPEARQDELALEAGTEPAPERARAGAQSGAGAETVPTDNSRDTGGVSRVTKPDVTRDEGGLSHECHAQNRSKGRDREGKGDSIESEDTPKAPFDVPALAAELATLGGFTFSSDRARANAEQQVRTWIADGIAPDTMRAAIRAFVRSANKPSYSLKRFNGAVRLQHAKEPAKVGTGEKPASLGPDDPDPRLADLRRTLRKTLGARTYDGWVAPGQFSLNGSGVVLTMPSRFLADWCESHLSSQLTSAALLHDLGSLKVQPPQPLKG